MTDSGVVGPFASVAVPIPARRLFTYRVAERHRASIAAGVRVRVPFGRRRMEGTVVEWPAAPPEAGIEIREIDAVLDRSPRLDDSLLGLTRFLADYYVCSWGEAIQAALPPDPPPASVTKLVKRSPGADPSVIPGRAVARKRVFEMLPADGGAIPLGRLGVAGRRAVRALVEAGLAEIVEEVAASGRLGSVRAPAEGARLSLTAPQIAALAQLRPAVEARRYAPFLLFGATGSGKTEVYLRAAESAIAAERGVLYLVPEIGLTPLLGARLRERFPDDVAVLHSALTPRERHEAWERTRRGDARFVVGARSAVFAPIRDLGLVVVDEEQDASYKQGESPRYNGRDLAVVRAREAGAVLLMGSATPSLESFQHARSGKYALLRLGGRVEGRPLPAVQLVDMRAEYRDTGRLRPLSRVLVAALRERLDRGEQAIVLRNRRGWASALLCPACGARVTCARCSIAMTWHRSAGKLRCHYCGLETRQPARCPVCGSEELKLLGEGTERIEDELKEALEGARVERMDRDSVRRRGAHEALLGRFDRGEIDVLVGTQMIAKGHDFPRVTLVGVVSADQTLGLPDFRAAERTFQLLTQVSGRAGRGAVPGSVIVQAFDPSHPVLQAAVLQDYEAFFDREIDYRKALRYPPVAALVEVMVEDRDRGKAARWAEIVADSLRREGEGRLILAGPGPAPIERLRGRYRMQILARSAGRRRLVAAVARAVEGTEGKVPRRAVTVDVDPVSVM